MKIFSSFYPGLYSRSRTRGFYAPGIKITDDQIRIWNPGELPKEITTENIFTEHLSIQCNPLLANIFFKCGMIEAWGRGYQKILHFCKLDKSKAPELDLSLGGVCVRCFASDFYKSLGKGIEQCEEEPENHKTTTTSFELEESDVLSVEIIKLIKENPFITYDTLSSEHKNHDQQ